MAQKKHREDLIKAELDKDMSDLDFEGQDRKLLEFLKEEELRRYSRRQRIFVEFRDASSEEEFAQLFRKHYEDIDKDLRDMRHVRYVEHILKLPDLPQKIRSELLMMSTRQLRFNAIEGYCTFNNGPWGELVNNLEPGFTYEEFEKKRKAMGIELCRELVALLIISWNASVFASLYSEHSRKIDSLWDPAILVLWVCGNMGENPAKLALAVDAIEAAHPGIVAAARDREGQDALWYLLRNFKLSNRSVLYGADCSTGWGLKEMLYRERLAGFDNMTSDSLVADGKKLISLGCDPMRIAHHNCCWVDMLTQKERDAVF